MDTKPVFHCLLGAFLFGELLRLDLFTVRNQMFFLWELCNACVANANKNFQFEFARACCPVMFFFFAE